MHQSSVGMKNENRLRETEREVLLLCGELVEYQKPAVRIKL